MDREFLVYHSDYTQSELLPVVISLHGTLGSAEQMMNFADFRPLADAEKFIIVCPEGITQTWNDGRATKANKAGVDDVKFLDELITHLLANYPIDFKRVYITGMSNGGFMASRLACEIPDRITAIAAVAATLDKASSLRPTVPMPVMYIHGTKDRIVPYVGGPTKAAGGNVYGHEEVLSLWVDVNQCTHNTVVETLPDEIADGTHVTRTVFSDPVNGNNVIGYTIVNGGHTWPSGPQYAPVNFVGQVSQNLDACQVIWDFFKAYSK